MKQGGLLFPKESTRKKTEEAPQKHHRQRHEESVLHLRQNRLYRTPSYLWQRKPQILRTIWLSHISVLTLISLSSPKRVFRPSKKVKNMAGSPLPELTFRRLSVILVVLQLSQVAKARLMYSRT